VFGYPEKVNSIVGILLIVALLTLIGSLALAFFAYEYYWGERGSPPLTGEARRLQKEKELRERAVQIEYSEKNPPRPRSQDFWNNQKQ
jgi:hypothetical protein